MTHHYKKPSFQSHSETSHAASITVNAKTYRIKILSMIRDAGSYGATNDEISAAFDKTGSYFSPRLIELERRGKIVKTTIERKTRAGRQANVYLLPRFAGACDVIKTLPPKDTRAIAQWFVQIARRGQREDGFADVTLTPIEVQTLKQLAREVNIPWLP